MQVQKRSGQIVPFEKEKIINALTKAGQATGEYTTEKAQEMGETIYKLISVFSEPNPIPIEHIQDVVEEELIYRNFIKTARAYIRYREQHRINREDSNTHISVLNSMTEYLNRSDWRVKANANQGYSLGGLILNSSGKMTANYWLNNVYPPLAAQAHRDGDIHISDLDMLSGYCSGWSLRTLLEEGFNGVPNKISSNPPKHMSTAINQMVNFLGTLQNEWAGAQAFSGFDTYLAPYIRIDNLDYNEVKQHVQEFVFGMNVSSRWGTQVPFSNVTFDTVIPEDISWHHPKIGGIEVEFTYSDLQIEVDMINKAFLEVMLEGDAQKRTFPFPIPTYNITKDFQWNHPNTDLLFELTAKYGVPYFQNFINSDLNPKDIRSMCPIGGDEHVLIQSDRYTHSELVSIKNLTVGKLYKVFSNGIYVSGIFNKYTNKVMKTISLANHHTLTTTIDHANFVAIKSSDGTIKTTTLPTSELTPAMYLPYSLTPYAGDGGLADLGYLVGCYAGDGSICDNIVTFSLNDTKKIPVLQKIQEIVLKYFGNKTTIYQNEEEHLVTLRVPSQAVVGLCQEFVIGHGINKHYATKLYDMSFEFRKAVVDGHYATDGGNRNRIYTSSKKMVTSLNLLAATLGTTTAITCDNRDGRYSENPNYGVLFYQLNRESYGDIWFKHDGYLWMKITNIEDNSSHIGYCFTITDEFSPIFTVATTGILTHNCRLQLRLDELLSKGNGLFGSAENTGSIGLSTLNMARLGYRTKGNKVLFFSEMDKLLEYSKEVLELKRKMLTRWYEMGLYPYTKRYLKGYNTFFSTIGINGVNECILNFTNGEHSIVDEYGHSFAIEILEHLRNKMVEFQQETGHMYNCEATPGESLTYRFARIDQKTYPDIIQAGTPEAPYYTNSTQLPVGLEIDLFEALKHQEPFLKSYTGGSVHHVFLGERMPNAQTCKKLVKKVLTNFKIPYMTITPSYSICPIHGYIAGGHKYCPQCDTAIITETINQEAENGKT